MECFTHNGVPAIGICKVCGKAVCRTCVVDAGAGITWIVCSAVCAHEAADLHEMNQRGKKIYGIGVAKPKVPSGVVMWLLFAALFGSYGIYDVMVSNHPTWFFLAFAALAIVIAIFVYRRAKDTGLQY